MAGKTLPGIGDDESGEHEVAADTSDSALRAGKAAPARATDRMPMALPLPSTTTTAYNGPTQVDDDKVAEGLKKLRSLDEPLGPIPNSMPTLKEGIPAVGGTTAPTMPAAGGTVMPGVPALGVSELRSRGTAHGHALSTPGGGQGLVPVTVDDRLKGTLLGHSLHLPDVTAEESRPAEVRSIAPLSQVAPTGALTPGEMHTDFSHGDARFFESEPLNTELEPEHPRSSVMMRSAIFVAVIVVFVVAAFAWVHGHKSETVEVPPPELRVVPPAEATLTPTPVDNQGGGAGVPVAAPGTTNLGGGAPTAAPSAAGTPSPTTAIAATAASATATAPVAPTAADDEAKAAADAEAAQNLESPSAKLEREVAAAAAKSAVKSSTRSSPRSARPPRQIESSHAAVPGGVKPSPSRKHAKVEEDPDGTLPLSD
jgi:hypothetical protein